MLRCRVLLSLSPCILVSAYSSLQQFLPMEDITQVRGSDSMTGSMVFHIKDQAVQTPLFMFFSKGGGRVCYITRQSILLVYLGS